MAYHGPFDTQAIRRALRGAHRKVIDIYRGDEWMERGEDLRGQAALNAWLRSAAITFANGQRLRVYGDDHKVEVFA